MFEGAAGWEGVFRVFRVGCVWPCSDSESLESSEDEDELDDDSSGKGAFAEVFTDTFTTWSSEELSEESEDSEDEDNETFLLLRFRFLFR